MQYQDLTEKQDKRFSNLSLSNDTKILELIKKLGQDTTVTDEFKRKILTADNSRAVFLRMSHKADNRIDFVRAILDACPDEETKTELLTAQNGNAMIYAKPIEATTLLQATEDEDTQRCLILSKRYKNGKCSFEEADFRKKRAMLASCSPNIRQEILSSPKIIFENDLEELMKLAQTQDMQLSMLTTKYEGENLLHSSTQYHDTKFILDALKNYPDILKRLLLDRNNQGDIPVNSGDSKLLIEASPDNETLKAQLTSRDYSGHLPIAYENKYGNIRWYLQKSPDDETLYLQLFEKLQGTDEEKFVISTLTQYDLIDLLGYKCSTEFAKKLLFYNWSEPTGDKDSPNVPNGIPLLLESLKENPSSFFEEVLLKIIQDDSTTNEEARALIARYKNHVSAFVKETLEQFDQYLESQEQDF